MLIVTRRIRESLYAGDEIKITVLDIKGQQVRIGIEAPKNIAVHREEIYERVLAERARGAREHEAGLRDDLGNLDGLPTAATEPADQVSRSDRPTLSLASTKKKGEVK